VLSSNFFYSQLLEALVSSPHEVSVENVLETAVTFLPTGNDSALLTIVTSVTKSPSDYGKLRTTEAALNCHSSTVFLEPRKDCPLSGEPVAFDIFLYFVTE
jgi:hypothetical protein